MAKATKKIDKKADKKINKKEENKMGALKTALAQIEKEFGKGSVMKLGESKTNKNIESIPTGSLGVDLALGIGGVPKGRIIEIFGPESSGKTTLALHIVAEAQKAGGIVSYIDAEHALDPAYAGAIGVNINELYISQPDDGEQALEIAEAMVRSGAIELIVIDSVAALVPRAEIEGEMGDSHVGLQARLMSQALRKITGIAHKTNCTIIFINQLREKIGVTYGSPETTTGGRALKFYASVRIDIRKAESIKSGTDIVGSRTKIKVAKNKMAPPFKLCEFDIMYGEGISREGDILDLAVDLDIVNKSGSWYSYNEDRLGQGRENAKKYFKENPHISREIENKVRAHYDVAELPVVKPPKEEPVEEEIKLDDKDLNKENENINLEMDNKDTESEDKKIKLENEEINIDDIKIN